MVVDPSSYNCQGRLEDISHVLRECSMARKARRLLLPNGNMDTFFQGSIGEWLSRNLRGDSLVGRENWSLMFGVSCWML